MENVSFKQFSQEQSLMGNITKLQLLEDIVEASEFEVVSVDDFMAELDEAIAAS